MRRMAKWPPKAADFTVTVMTNAQASTRYNNIPEPVLAKLGNPNHITFSIRGTRSLLSAGG